MLGCAADVLCGLLRADAEVRRRALSALLLLLSHKWPRVRRFVAEKLYLALMAAEDVVPEEALDEVNDILTETLWDDAIAVARERRNRISDLVGLPRPTVRKNAGAVKPAAKPADDLDSYRDLVERTGY